MVLIDIHQSSSLALAGGGGGEMLTWKWKQFTVCEVWLAGWLAVSDLTVCVLMTQEICVVPGIVSSLISRHCLSSHQAVSLLCYSVFLISILNNSGPSLGCSLISNLIKVGRKPKFFPNFICLTIKVRRALTQNIGGICWLRVWI